MINTSRSLIFTTALSDHTILSVIEVYDMMSFGSLKKLKSRDLVRLFKQSMKEVENFDQNRSNSHIQAVIVPGNEAVLEASKKLVDAGFDVRPIRFPSVPKGKERLRVCIHEFNTEDEVIDLCSKFKEALN